MSVRRACFALAGLAALLSLTAGCGYRTAQSKPPADSATSRAIGEMYLRAGLASEVTTATLLGKHYRPGLDSWKVVACVEFAVSDTETARDCNDSFELYKMDSGSWMVNGTLNGSYLWLEMP